MSDIQRDEVLDSVAYRMGREYADVLRREIERLASRIRDLEAQNAAMRQIIESRNLRARLGDKYGLGENEEGEYDALSEDANEQDEKLKLAKAELAEAKEMVRRHPDCAKCFEPKISKGHAAIAADAKGRAERAEAEVARLGAGVRAAIALPSRPMFGTVNAGQYWKRKVDLVITSLRVLLRETNKDGE